MKEHKLSLTSAVLLNINILIGSAILFGSGRSAAVAGNASFLSWILVALLFLPLVLSTARLSSMFPGCGGFYSYAKEGLNDAAGYISALLYIMGYTLAAVVEVVFVRQMIIAAVGNHWFLDSAVLFNGSLVLFCAVLNALPFGLFSTFLNTMSVTKILPLATLIVLLPFVINPHFTITTAEIMKIPAGLPFVIFGFWGFEYCCSLTHLIKDGKRNGPLATLIGFFVTVVLYTLFHFGALQVMGAENLGTLGAPNYASFLTLPIPYLKAFLIFLIPIASVITIFAAINGLINANIVLMHALAQERLFWQWRVVTKTNRFDRPWAALVIQSIIIFSMATLLSINMIGNLCNLAIVLSFMLPFISLLLIQKRNKMHWGMALTSAAIAVTLGFSAYSWYQLGSTMTERCFGTGLFIAMVVLGYMLYLFRGKKPKNGDFDLSQEIPIHT